MACRAAYQMVQVGFTIVEIRSQPFDCVSNRLLTQFLRRPDRSTPRSLFPLTTKTAPLLPGGDDNLLVISSLQTNVAGVPLTTSHVHTSLT